jgi:hypothetical protein
MTNPQAWLPQQQQQKKPAMPQISSVERTNTGQTSTPAFTDRPQFMEKNPANWQSWTNPASPNKQSGIFRADLPTRS